MKSNLDEMFLYKEGVQKFIQDQLSHKDKSQPQKTTTVYQKNCTYLMLIKY